MCKSCCACCLYGVLCTMAGNKQTRSKEYSFTLLAKHHMHKKGKKAKHLPITAVKIVHRHLWTNILPQSRHSELKKNKEM